MLLLHQSGSLKVGEIVRYTVTYTPAHDRILPPPSQLFLKIKNTSAIALRAAFVHGPYTLYAAAYPANFDPNSKCKDPQRDGIPEFEPNLKAGGTFSTELEVPEDVRETAGIGARHVLDSGDGEVKSVSWIVEVTSQVVFSTSATVNYEILVGRDEKSLNMGFASGIGGGTPAPTPGRLSDFQQSQGAKDGHHNGQQKGVYSKAITLKVQDTTSLWKSPDLPEWTDDGNERFRTSSKATEDHTGDSGAAEGVQKPKRQKKVHLVVLTHGLHSNLGADLLYLKESIDAAAKQAKIDAKTRRAKRKQAKNEAANTGESKADDEEKRTTPDGSTKPPAEQLEGGTDEDEDEEEIIVRGFSGNAVRTERGIKYLGKRLARYVLNVTYPDQPFRPITKKSTAEALSTAFQTEETIPDKGTPSHHHSIITKESHQNKKLAYKITSISFIAHSLGGLIQTYAVAYIQKHSPHFFEIIKPINFIALASPFLGLSNENPLYVKFALDFGLVGRTGKDLGLTWRAPTIARSGWGAIVGSIGESAQKKIEGDVAPESKPLLRILPTGPAHAVLKKFRNRTVYSNVVNDGIVPLRTSCLLFLDWSGLGRVEKARRENGLVGTIAGWGWAEVTGQNTSSPMRQNLSGASWGSSSDTEDAGDNTPTRQGRGQDVPEPPASATEDDAPSFIREHPHSDISSSDGHSATSLGANTNNPLSGFFNLFKPTTAPKPHNDHPKHTKIYKRSQTISLAGNSSVSASEESNTSKERIKATSGDSEHEDFDRLSAPPKTTFFESAGDLLKPPLPPVQFLIDPKSRPRTIFHDRVYHPEDIPPPPLKKRQTSSLLRRRSSSAVNLQPPPKVPHTDTELSTRDYDDTKNTNPDKDPYDVIDGSAMKVEEKIARAYHRDLSWRKVLVRLEPDAHNNMIVRRMFANAYGWPVVKHLCDTHFSDLAVANTRDDNERSEERAKESNEAPDDDGGEMKNHEKTPGESSSDKHTDSDSVEAKDKVPPLRPGSLGPALAGKELRKPAYERRESEAWSDRDWADSEVDSEDEDPKKSNWNWTEAIAGMGALDSKSSEKSRSEHLPNRRSVHEEDGNTFDRRSPATRHISEQAVGMGHGLGQMSIDD
jgi:hypothetical protein